MTGDQTIEDREGRPLVGPGERLWALGAHIGGLATTVVLPLMIYVLKRDESEFVAHAAREALNFQMTLLMVGFVSAAIVCAQPLLISVVALLDFVLCLVSAIRAYDGKRTRYPISFRLIR